MKITQTFTVPTDPDTVFTLLNDADRVVLCLPGAALLGSDGDTHRGHVKIKIGPVAAIYEGTVRFVESDRQTHTMRLSARGSDVRGNGGAEAVVDVRITGDPAQSVVSIETDLMIRGKLAQLGGSVISTVSERLLDQFAANLEQLVTTDPGAVTVPTMVRDGELTLPVAPEAPHVDALSLLGRPLALKYGIYAALLALGIVQGYWVGRAVTIERAYQRQS